MERPRPDIDSVRNAMRERDAREDDEDEREDAEDQPPEDEDEDED
jgi:hypothetical protein